MASDSTEKSNYKYYVLLVLALVYLSNYIDRSIMAVISPAVKEDLGLSDTQLGLLKGLSFALFYAALCIPVAWLAERWRRVPIISVSVMIWSVFTALAAFAGNFFQLFLTRVGVGIAEAGGVAPSHSLISDYFKKEERGRALALYSMAVDAGDAIALLLGGILLQQFGWRFVFLIIGIPGVLLALVLWATVKEPIRGAMDGPSQRSQPQSEPLGFFESIKALWSIGSYRYLVYSAIAVDFAASGFWFWMVDHFERSFELSYVEITTPLAVITVLFSVSGTYTSGYLTDKLHLRTAKSNGYVGALSAGMSAPLLIVFLLAPTPFWSFVAVAGLFYFITMYLPTVYAGAQTIAPAHLRTVSASLLFAATILFGVGCAPLVVGLLSDFVAPFFGEANGLKVAISAMSIVFVLGVFLFLQTGRRMAAEAALAEEAAH